MPQSTFETISSTSKSGAQDGTAVGNAGSGQLVTASESAQVAWLVARSPDQVNAALLASVKSSLGVELSVVSENRFPEGKPSYRVAVGTEIECRSVEDAKVAAERFQAAMIPAPKPMLEEWFYAIRLATVGGSKSEMDEEARLALYVSALVRYPADIARAVCTWFTTHRGGNVAWFPPLPDLIAEADKLLASREVIIAGLLAWKPKTSDQERHEEARELLFQAVEMEREAFAFKRSDAPKYAAMMADAKALRTKAADTRRGGPQPETPDAI